MTYQERWRELDHGSLGNQSAQLKGVEKGATSMLLSIDTFDLRKMSQIRLIFTIAISSD